VVLRGLGFRVGFPGLPIFAGFDEHGDGESQERCFVGEERDDSRAAFVFLVAQFQHVGRA